MSRGIRGHLRSNVVGYVAIFLFAIGGTAYATHPGGANTISNGDIINGQVFTQDIADNNLTSLDVRNDTLGDGGLQAIDLRADSVGTQEIAAGGVGSSEVIDDSLQQVDLANDVVASAEIVDDSITGADIQSAPPFGSGGFNGDVEIIDGTVSLFDIGSNQVQGFHVDDGSLNSPDTNQFSAVVNADGTLARASVAGVTSATAGPNDYVVDFGRDISACSFVATIGLSGQSGIESPGFITVVGAAVALGEGVFVSTYDTSGADATRGFHLQVSCDD